MACAFTSGRTEPCFDSIGGLKAAYSIDFVEDSFTITSGEATALSGSVTVTYKYNLNSDENTFNEPATADKSAGTTTYAQELKLHLKKQTKDSANELHLLVKARPVWVVLDRNDNYRVVGLSDGCTGAIEITSGGSKEEFNGYDLTFTATETEPAPYLDSATETAFLAIVSGSNINP